MKHIISFRSVAFLLLVFALSTVGNSVQARQDGLAYKAIKVGKDRDIDDTFKKQSKDGWYPLFVIKDIEETIESYKDTDGKMKTRDIENIRWCMLFGREKE